VFSKAVGSRLIAEDGREFVDFLAERPLAQAGAARLAEHGPVPLHGRRQPRAGGARPAQRRDPNVAPAHRSSRDRPDYGFLFAREVATRSGPARPSSGRLRVVAQSLRALTYEFGPTEVLDSAVVRPACTAIATATLGTAAGVLVAKLVADVLFYVPVICTYELRRRRGYAA
jgi:hypothetical protein